MGEVAGRTSAAHAEDGCAAVFKVEEFGFIGKLVAKRVVKPVNEWAGHVSGVIETGDASLAEHGVRVYMVVGLADVMHVCSLLATDVWKANDLCGVQEGADVMEVDVLILCVDCYG